MMVLKDSTPRLDSLGRVIALLAGEDGVSKVARLRTATGETTRDFTLLYPLETSLRPKELTTAPLPISPNSTLNDSNSEVPPLVIRSRRAAAFSADASLRDKIKKEYHYRFKKKCNNSQKERGFM